VQVINTKLSIPPSRAKLVERSRLIDKLNQGFECGFVLVSAPAGYGKTTLLSAWLSQLDFACAWLSLDSKDNDLTRFLAYLVSAIQTIDPSIKQYFDSELEIYDPPDPESILTPLVNHFTRAKQPFCLILDDYHVIQNQAVQQAVRFLIEHRPTPLRLVIATRSDPSLPLARMRARGAMLELRQADLCFTAQEADNFLRITMGLQVSPEDIAQITDRTEGWVAGLQMAGLSIQGRADISGFVRSFSGENRHILDFLFDEVFKRQSVDIQDFLLRTSILERLCGSLCDTVTLGTNSQDMLETLERNNLFLIKLDEEKKWYRYHFLFSDLLQSRLKQTELISSALLHQRASAWYAEQQDLENAIAHSLAAPEYERAADLIEQVLQTIDMINQQPLLSSWIDRLPRETLTTHPWLCAHRAYSYYWIGQREMAEAWLRITEEYSETAFEADSLELRLIQGFIASVRAHTALVGENIPYALMMAQMALDLLPERDVMRGATAVALGAAYWAMGDVINSEQAFKMAQIAASDAHQSMAVSPACYRGIQQIKQGCLKDSIATFRDGLLLATLPDGREAAIAGFPNIRLGDVLRQQNVLDQASLHLQRGFEQCRRLQQVDFLTDAYVCLGRYQLAVGDREGMLASLEEANRLVKHSRIDQWVLCWLDDLRLRTWLAAGDLNSALLWAKNSGLTPDGPFSYIHDLHHQNLARLLVAQSQLAGSKEAHEQATALLARLRAAAQQAGWVHEEINILVLQAVNDQANGKTDVALNSLAEALSLAQPGGYVRIFLDEGDIIQSLLMLLAEQLRYGQQRYRNIPQQQLVPLAGYVAELLSAFKSAAGKRGLLSGAISMTEPAPDLSPESSIQRQNLVEPLSKRELEVLRLLARGYSDKQIAGTLFIAPETVHKHLKNIYGKLDVHSRTEAIAQSREFGLL
jgi:ATP/maltotriose-dependent transcriptional regulator MalT